MQEGARSAGQHKNFEPLRIRLPPKGVSSSSLHASLFSAVLFVSYATHSTAVCSSHAARRLRQPQLFFFPMHNTHFLAAFFLACSPRFIFCNAPHRSPAPSHISSKKSPAPARPKFLGISTISRGSENRQPVGCFLRWR